MTGILQSERREEILALLARTEFPVGFRHAPNPRSRGYYNSTISLALNGSTLSRQVAFQISRGRAGEGTPTDLFRLVGQLRDLLGRGSLSLEEANAYFNGIYNYEGLFTSLPSSRARQAANQTEVDLVEEGQTQADVARVVSEESQAAQAVQGSGGLQAATIEIGQLPDQYRLDAVTGVMREAFDQVEQQIAAIRAGRVAFAPNSIDGSVIRSGTIRSVKLDPLDVSQRLQQWPTDLEAIEVAIDQDTGVDRWHSAGDLTYNAGGAHRTRGPGRVWRARELRLPPSYRRPTGGPMRYRVVQPQLELGLMSITRIDESGLHAGHADARYRLRYGIVIRGLRYFGDRPPTSILSAWVGAHPASQNATFSNTNNLLGTPQLFDGAARTAFNNRASTLLVPFAKLASAQIAPTPLIVDACRGFQFGLITGETWRDTYGQLNGSRSSYGRLTGGAQPTWADGEQTDREAPASAVVVTAESGTPNSATYRTGSLASDEEGVINGVPFSPEDCGVLAPNLQSRTFSIVVEARLDHVQVGSTIAGWLNSSTRDMRPGAWWTSGVRVAPAGQRRTLIDVVVF